MIMTFQKYEDLLTRSREHTLCLMILMILRSGSRPASTVATETMHPTALQNPPNGTCDVHSRQKADHLRSSTYPQKFAKLSES